MFVDDDDARAALTAYWFRRMGFPNVLVLNGGMPAWRDAGLPEARGRGRPTPLGIEAARARAPAIDADALAKRLGAESPPVIVDVGTSKAVAAGHVAGAVWIPRGALEDRIGAVAGTDTAVVITAAQPDQAAFAAQTLADMGYADVAWLGTPGRDWAETLPIESGLPGDAVAEDTLAIPYRQDEARMREYLEWEEKLGEKYKRTAATDGAGG